MKIENIKFKAKRLDNGEWIYGSLIRSTAGVKERAYIVDNFSSMSDYSIVGIDPSTVCMFTGLKDKDGNEIYEHDFISISKDREPCEVIFEKGCFLAFNPKTLIRIPLIRGIDYYTWELHVVGNKFDKENNL